ncbi:hypothetical protein ACFY00_11375 [Kitasatospora sp. NPDC001540]
MAAIRTGSRSDADLVAAPHTHVLDDVTQPPGLLENLETNTAPRPAP